MYEAQALREWTLCLDGLERVCQHDSLHFEVSDVGYNMPPVPLHLPSGDTFVFHIASPLPWSCFTQNGSLSSINCSSALALRKPHRFFRNDFPGGIASRKLNGFERDCSAPSFGDCAGGAPKDGIPPRNNIGVLERPWSRGSGDGDGDGDPTGPARGWALAGTGGVPPTRTRSAARRSRKWPPGVPDLRRRFAGGVTSAGDGGPPAMRTLPLLIPCCFQFRIDDALPTLGVDCFGDDRWRGPRDASRPCVGSRSRRKLALQMVQVTLCK